MKHIALGLTVALLMTTNFGYAKDLIISKKTSGDLAEAKAGSAEGGVHSGGGTLVQTASGTGLLDLYLYNRTAFSATEQGSTLPETRSYKDMGFDRLSGNNIAFLQKTLDQVQKWQRSSPVVSSEIAKALSALPIYYINFELAFKDQMAFLPEGLNISQSDLKLAAYYIADFGVFVEKKTFDGLSEKNQMALLIHEALRHMQLSYASGLTNENIQKLTAQVLKDPQSGVTLDRPGFIGKIAQEDLDRRAEIHALGSVVIAEYCAIWGEKCDLSEEDLIKSYQDGSQMTFMASEMWHEMEIYLSKNPDAGQAMRIEALNNKLSQLSHLAVLEALVNLVDGNSVGLFTLRSNLLGGGYIDFYAKRYNEAGRFSDGQELRTFVNRMKSKKFVR